MKQFFMWIWQLPQHLLALALIWVLDAAKTRQPQTGIDYWFYKPKNRFSEFITGVSLGNYIIIKTKDEATIRHEYGHSIQSRAWGPLYLLAVGITSALFNNLWDRWFHKSWSGEERYKWYYSRYPEKQADALAGVIRDFKEDKKNA